MSKGIPRRVVTLADGRQAIEFGHRWASAKEVPFPLRWDGTLKRCGKCKTDTPWRTPLGRATHPCCEDTAFDGVTPDYLMDLISGIAERLSIARIDLDYVPAKPRPADPHKARRPYFANPDAGCEVCGIGGASLWRPDNVWRCWSHNPMEIRTRPRWSR